MSDKLARLQTALAANHLDTCGTFEECLNRLLGATTRKRKRPAKDRPPAATTAVAEAILQNVVAKLELLPEANLRSLAVLIGASPEGNRESLASSVAVCLVTAV